MTARLDHRLPLTVLAGVLFAGGLGLVAGADPIIAIGAALGLVYVAVTFSSLSAGVCLMAVLTILDAQGTVNVAKPAGAVLAASWLAMLTARRMRRRAFVVEHALLAYALLIFLAWIALSAVWAESSNEALTAFIRYLPNALLIPIVYDAIQERRHAVWILGTLAAAAAVAAAIGIVHAPANPSAVDTSDRVTSTFGDANELAAALLVGAAVAGAFALRRATLPVMRLLAVGGAAMCVLAIFLTLSRGGLIAMGAGLATCVLFAGRWRARMLLAAMLVLLAAVGYFSLFASLPARERVTNVGGGTGRLDVWTVGGRMVAANKLTGVGAGNFQVASVHYLLRPGVTHRADFIISTPKVAHNTYLQEAAELGIPVACLFGAIVAFCLGCAAAAARAFARAGEIGMEIMSRGVVVAMVSYFTAILFISEMYSKLFWMLLALGPALYALSRQEASAAEIRRG